MTAVEDRTKIIQLLRDYGYAFIPCWQKKLSTTEAVEQLGTVTNLKTLLPGSGIPSVQKLVPRRKRDSPISIYSGAYGLDAFPLHTDLAHWAVPPRYFLLRCILGNPAVKTKLLPATSIIREFGQTVLQRALVRPRRSSRNVKARLLRVVFTTGGIDGLRWDPLFLKPMNPTSSDLTDHVTLKQDNWAGLTEICLCDPGDTLIVDNWRMLHGRSPASSVDNRLIERAYISEISE